MTNEAKRTTLDDAYDVYWQSPVISDSNADELLTAVRSFTLRMTSFDEDAAQTACLIVFQGLERFRRADEQRSRAGHVR
jgi:hypothetical protein